MRRVNGSTKTVKYWIKSEYL